MVTGSSLQTFSTSQTKIQEGVSQICPMFLGLSHPCLLVKRTRLGGALVKMGNPKWTVAVTQHDQNLQERGRVGR